MNKNSNWKRAVAGVFFLAGAFYKKSSVPTLFHPNLTERSVFVPATYLIKSAGIHKRCFCVTKNEI